MAVVVLRSLTVLAGAIGLVWNRRWGWSTRCAGVIVIVPVIVPVIVAVHVRSLSEQGT